MYVQLEYALYDKIKSMAASINRPAAIGVLCNYRVSIAVLCNR